MVSIDNPTLHYDHVTRAWRFLLGDNFHFGYFRTEADTLDTATENLTMLMAEHGSIAAGISVLDVGCGIGTPACLLAERFACRVTGITTSQAGVELATRNAQERGLSNRVEFVQADGMKNGMADASFDVV